MKETQKKCHAHLFICTSCTYTDEKGLEAPSEHAQNLRKSLKSRCAEKFSKEDVRISQTTCLGQCEQGIAAVLYPNQTWFTQLTPKDEDQLFEKIEKAVKQVKS